MKTEQEQIEEMARSMCGYCSTDGKCAVSKNWREPDICANVDTEHCLYKEYAERLIESGYGDVTEYKAEREMLGSQIKVLKQRLNNKYVEIEQLKSEFNQLQTNAEILAQGVRDFNHENYELTEKVKQAKIDILNKVKSLAIYDDNYLDGYVFIDDINKLIEEVENDNSKSN